MDQAAASRAGAGLPDRNQAVEALRVVSAFGIVWFHANIPGHTLAYSGLSAFLCLATYFECRRSPSRPLEAGKLTSRLILPWAAFYAFFGLIDLFRHRPLGPGTLAGAVLIGPSPHLWFLPFAFGTRLLIRLFRQRAPRFPLAHVAAAVLAADICLSLLGHAWRATSQPLTTYAAAVPPSLFGIALAVAKERRSMQAAIAILLGLAALAAASGSEGWLPLLIGCGASALAVLFGDRLSLPNLTGASSLTFGIYLMHPVFLSLTAPIRHMNGAVGVAVAFTATAGCVWIYRRAVEAMPSGQLAAALRPG